MHFFLDLHFRFPLRLKVSTIMPTLKELIIDKLCFSEHNIYQAW